MVAMSDEVVSPTQPLWHFMGQRNEGLTCIHDWCQLKENGGKRGGTQLCFSKSPRNLGTTRMVFE